ncbi:MAG: molybdate ABC transporter permease subunit [Acidiphilium sp.]|nr:molybdate ABC transporter permease subunit [Acidiphilium sp.]MDD4935175.1 molybdate ABC transporter permease subunit [Acidiphilium sp.]
MWPAIVLTLELATVTTAILILIGTPLAWWLARSKSWTADVISTVVALPIVLPPTALGFYLLVALGPHGPFASLLPFFGLRSLAFSFNGLVIGSVIYSLPFMVQPIRNAFRVIGDAPLEVAAMLRASPLDAFFSVAVPLAQGGIFTGSILSFAHTIGEFGVVLMIGGDIPGKTEVLSIIIFNDVETMQWRAANIVSAYMVLFAFAVILVTMMIERRTRRLFP